MREPWERGCRRSSAEAPAGYPNKNSNNRKLASARWTIGGGKRFSLYGYLRKSFSSRFFRKIVKFQTKSAHIKFCFAWTLMLLATSIIQAKQKL